MTGAPTFLGSKWKLAARIAAIAGLILFLELALIRFLGAYVRVFAFFTNFVIIGAFLGMGAGLLRRKSADRLRWAFPFLLVALVAMTLLLNRVKIDAGADRLEWLWTFEGESDGFMHVPLTVAVVALFGMITALFVPLGAQLGAAMARWRALPAYAADLAGSLIGIIAFALVSAAELSPVVWFACAGLVWTLLCLPDLRPAALAAAATAGTVAIVVAMGSRSAETWSPYYRITTKPAPEHAGSTQIDVNGALHQVMLDFSAAPADARMDSVLKSYERPYDLLPVPDTALVVGAGTGNDVALLLKRGAKHVDAVEIDPVIARIGRERHPLRPYDDPRVHLVVNDARAFLRTPAHRYDVVVFGTLDSHTLLGGISSARLDNYVYTEQSFRAARAALKPGGSVVLYHLSGYWFIAARIFQNLAVAFDAPPAVLLGGAYHFNYTFIAGAGSGVTPPVPAGSPLLMSLRLATDDWPFPYLRGRRIPSHYIVVLAAVLALSVGVVVIAAGRVTMRKPHWPLFWVGCGFLLLETKGITTLSLLFGSTWTVNAAVIASILGVALAAAVMTHVGRAPPVPVATAALAILLVAATAIEPSWLVSNAPWLRWLAAALYVGLPVLFASFVFASAYATTTDATSALAFNILGAVAGGLLEYASMSFGLSALNWLAVAAYLFAVFLLSRDSASQRRVAA